jgi:type II secretory pathway pseudopilin PulG
LFSEGLSGQILENKGRRDMLLQGGEVSRTAKALAWSFLFVLDVGMLGYIFLFAISQDEYRQKAWARSFAIWLLVEIVVVSSVMVIVTHIMLPILVLGDVVQIRKRLAESVQSYQRLLQQQAGRNAGEAYMVKDQESSDDNQEGGGASKFNAAKYLFVSNIVARNLLKSQRGREGEGGGGGMLMKVAGMIQQFSTPWPRQSYLHSHDSDAAVSNKYSKKFTAFTRSLSIIVMFFLTSWLSAPISFQDSLLQITNTVLFGYIILLFLEIYRISPFLFALPAVIVLVMIGGAYWFIHRRYIASISQSSGIVVVEEDLPKASSPPTPSAAAEQQVCITPAAPLVTNVQPESSQQQSLPSPVRRREPPPKVNLAVVGDSSNDEAVSSQQKGNHVTRRESIQQGMTLINQLQSTIQKMPSSSGIVDTPASTKTHSVPIKSFVEEDEEEDNSDSDMDFSSASMVSFELFDDHLHEPPVVYNKSNPAPPSALLKHANKKKSKKSSDSSHSSSLISSSSSSSNSSR